MVDKTRTLEIVLINPKFEVSYWGMEHALPLLGKKANLPVAGLPLLAALTPEQHHVTIVDENVEAIDFDRIAKADIVGITGMSVQKERMREIVDEFHQRGAFVVLGGPWITVSESYFGEIPKSIFVGEAEETWPQFLADFQRGEWKARYEAKRRPICIGYRRLGTISLRRKIISLAVFNSLVVALFSASSATSSSPSGEGLASRRPSRS